MGNRYFGASAGECLLGQHVGINLTRNALLMGLCLLAMLCWQIALGLRAFAQDYGFAPVSGQVTSPFGWRTDPITGSPRFHGGIDIASPMGTPVYAPQAGYVVYSGAYGGYGNVVVLDHGNSLYTVYGHNSQLLVRAGQTVYRGQMISLVGSTGRSTGPHLHFEVHYNQQYLNPVTYLGYFQQSYPMLAQVPHSAKVMGVANHTMAQADGLPVKVVHRHSGSAARHAGSGKVVQLVSGSDVEMIEF
jgi:hypothetical protein